MWRQWHGVQEYSDSWSDETPCDWSSARLANPVFAFQTPHHCHFAVSDPSESWTTPPNSPRSLRDRNGSALPIRTHGDQYSLACVCSASLDTQCTLTPAIRNLRMG